MAKRQVFFSFHYDNDNWRAGQVRSMGKVDGSSTFSDNDWEDVKRKSNEKIEEWIENQMKMRSCIVVLIGSQTSNRKWVIQEIIKAYNLGKGIVGIYVHNLKNREGKQSPKGDNPFRCIRRNKDGMLLSSFVTAYDPPYSDSKVVYTNIESKIEGLIEDAISKVGTY